MVVLYFSTSSRALFNLFVVEKNRFRIEYEKDMFVDKTDDICEDCKPGGPGFVFSYV